MKTAKTLRERFFEKIRINEETGCWEWTASCQPTGYGQINDRGVMHYAHRLSYQIHKGPIPKGLTVDHLCFVRKCVNPDHLEAVTNAENISRAGAAITHCSHGHEYTKENTYINPTNGYRQCRSCKPQNDKRFRKRHPNYSMQRYYADIEKSRKIMREAARRRYAKIKSGWSY